MEISRIKMHYGFLMAAKIAARANSRMQFNRDWLARRESNNPSKLKLCWWGIPAFASATPAIFFGRYKWCQCIPNHVSNADETLICCDAWPTKKTIYCKMNLMWLDVERANRRKNCRHKNDRFRNEKWLCRSSSVTMNGSELAHTHTHIHCFDERATSKRFENCVPRHNSKWLFIDSALCNVYIRIWSHFSLLFCHFFVCCSLECGYVIRMFYSIFDLICSFPFCIDLNNWNQFWASCIRRATVPIIHTNNIR